MGQSETSLSAIFPWLGLLHPTLKLKWTWNGTLNTQTLFGQVCAKLSELLKVSILQFFTWAVFNRAQETVVIISAIDEKKFL